MKPFDKLRNSRMELGEVYFWTSTIKDWKSLLNEDKYKELIINELKKLVDKGLMIVYGFVIMPNHIHLIWELKQKNGKEMPHASFNKATGHLLIKDLKTNDSNKLVLFKVNEKEREYRIWQRDPLAIMIKSRSMLEQKLIYIHNNPLQEKWNLAKFPEDYKWSSAAFYENDLNDFGIVTHYLERFG
ncbi:transposase [Fulvivirga sp.]|uniref:transposase n=1 Tax=Fulvivirga sp. TaxID=1931237 RepID=UPI0032EAE37F